MDFNQNELLAKVLFALFATMSLMMAKGHAASILSLKQEQAVQYALQSELQLQYPKLKVTFFRCQEQTRSCQIVLKRANGKKTICDLQDVMTHDFKRNSFAILDSFYFNQVKECL